MSDEIVKTETHGNDFSTFVKSLTSSNPEGVPNCKLCQSKFRKEAEARADQGQSVATIHRWLESQKEELSYNSVSNHMKFHYNSKRDDANLTAYAEKLAKWAARPYDEEEFLKRYIRAFDAEAMRMMANNADLDSSEQRKNNEIAVKLSAQADAFRQQLKELNGELKQVEIVITSLNRIIDFKISATNDPQIKAAINEIREMIKKELSDIPLDGNV